jgi:phosphoglycolate phosphatase-like HAD superfamily hydrolase
MPRAAILDVDGTLVDSNDAHAQAWVTAFNEAGIDVSYDRVRRAIGMGGDKLIPHVSGLTADSKPARRISARRGEIFRSEFLPHLTAFPKVRDLVEQFLADEYRVVIASSAEADELDPLLEIAGIAHLLHGRSSSKDADRSKPDPDIVVAALHRSGAGPAEAIMVGDTPYDVAAALAAGIEIVGVESGGWGSGDLQGATEVHTGVADLYAHYHDSLFARLAASSGLP